MIPIKKSILLFAVWFIACSLLVMTTTYAEVPPLINYQGKLLDSQGRPITGQRNITFRLYESSSGGTIKWQGTYSKTLENGIFNVMLGDVNDPGYNFSTLAFNVQYWLGIQVGGDPEMRPLQQIASSGYAFNAERLNGKVATEFSLANHTHDASAINAGVLPVARGGTGVAHKTVIAVPYTGTGIDNTVIPHGLGATPAFVFICATDNFGANAMLWGKGMPAGLSKDLVEYSAKTDCIKVVDSTNLILGPNGRVNGNGVKYIALCASE